MAITGSPDIFVSEQDLSTFVGSFDVTTAALVGDFEWGPVNQVTRISNEARLKTYFGMPNDRNFKDWLSAKNYLEYSNSLAVVRVCLPSARNAYFKPKSIKIPHYYAKDSSGTAITEYNDKTIVAESGYGILSDGLPIEITYENESQMYSPLTEEYSELFYDSVTTIKSSTITNFPNYVAFYNEDNQYTVDKTSAELMKSYGASPKYVLDLNAEKEIAKLKATNADLANDLKIAEKLPDETLDNMKLGTAYACVFSDNETKTFFYLRKKFERRPVIYEKDENGNFVKTNDVSLTTADSDTTNYKVKELNEDWLFYVGEESTGGYEIVFNKKYQDVVINNLTDRLGLTDYDLTDLVITNSEIQLNVKNATDYSVQENDIGSNKQVPILAKYPGKFGNKIHVAVINKPAYDAYMRAANGKEELIDLKNLTKNSAINLIGDKKFSDDTIIVAVSLYEPETGKYVLKEYGAFSLTKGSTDITGYDNYVFNFFNSQSNYVIFNKEAFEELFGYKYSDTRTGKDYVDLTRSFINIDAHLTNGVDYQTNMLGGANLNYSEVTTTISNGIDYEINTQMTPIVDKEYISDKTPLINIIGGVSAYEQGWDLFKNEESDDTRVELLMQGGGSPEIGQYIIDLAEKRKDCLACVSPTISECVNVTDPADRIADGTGSFYSNSSYAYMDGNYKYQYDSYNDVYRWMPLNADIAGLCAYVDATEEPWMSIGGRQIRNCIKLAFYPSKADRDVLFEHNVNSVTNFSNQGNVVWGDWTRVTNTAFNFLGVRRMFLYVEKNIKQFARTIMFKQNDQITRDEFVLVVEPFLDTVVGGRGIQEYAVFAGSDVTTLEEMDKGIFRAKFAIKPVRSIRYVDLVFVAIRSDMSVSEVIE